MEFSAIASAISSKANTDSPSFTGTPLTPTASTGTNTTQIASCAFVLANAVPSGAIIMWSGTIATIPSGWLLCNGSSGTPDLRNKFIVGAYSDNAGVANTTITGASTQTGGSADAVVVSHTHTATVTDTGHTHPTPNALVFTTGAAASTAAGTNVTSTTATGSATTGITVANSTTGVSGTNANLPPYYALAFIMKS